MISYIEYLNIPIALGLAIIGVFLIMQIVGEILEFKGKVVPEFIKIRKYFARKKQERQTMREMSATIHDVETVLNSVESHYSEDNIAKRDAWMKWVNDRALVKADAFNRLKKPHDFYRDMLERNSIRIENALKTTATKEELKDLFINILSDFYAVTEDEQKKEFFDGRHCSQVRTGSGRIN